MIKDFFSPVAGSTVISFTVQLVKKVIKIKKGIYFKIEVFIVNSIINYFILVAGVAEGVADVLIFLAKLANLMPKFNLNTG